MKKKLFLKISQYSRENTCVGVFFDKTADCNFNKKRLQHRCFPVTIAIFEEHLFRKHLRTTASVENLAEFLALS